MPILKNDEEIVDLLTKSKTIVVVGISNKKHRDSYKVARYLKEVGYEIYPVNPMIEEWEGLKSYKDLTDIPKEVKIDIVDVFRRSEFVDEIVDKSIEIGAKAVWLQLGIDNEKAVKKADAAGLIVVKNRCIMTEHQRLLKQLKH